MWVWGSSVTRYLGVPKPRQRGFRPAATGACARLAAAAPERAEGMSRGSHDPRARYLQRLDVQIGLGACALSLKAVDQARLRHWRKPRRDVRFSARSTKQWHTMLGQLQHQYLHPAAPAPTNEYSRHDSAADDDVQQRGAERPQGEHLDAHQALGRLPARAAAPTSEMRRPDRHRTGRPGRQRGRTRRVERSAAEALLAGLPAGT